MKETKGSVCLTLFGPEYGAKLKPVLVLHKLLTLSFQLALRCHFLIVEVAFLSLAFILENIMGVELCGAVRVSCCCGHFNTHESSRKSKVSAFRSIV